MRDPPKIHQGQPHDRGPALASLNAKESSSAAAASGLLSAPKIHFNKLMSYTEQMSSRGLTPLQGALAKVLDQ